jgi:16S rRNA (cytidine1402-2'-O)-methyltransferase
MSTPGLYVVATPIGNLEDISYRAVRVLSEAGRIAAEDTRHSRILLNHYGIGTPLVAFHEHNEAERTPQLVEQIRSGTAVALISDAGTPLISDPGFRLVQAVAAADLPVFTVPGPSAVTAALSIAGIATDRFLFEGFLPARSSARVKRLNALAFAPATLVFFESNHRIGASVADMCKVFGSDRQAAICRELTKKFETVSRGDLAHLCSLLDSDPNQSKGELVILVAGNDQPQPVVDGLALAISLKEHMPASQAARVAAKVCGGSRREIYKALEESQ